MSDLLTRIRQRKLVQWLVAYAAGAWVVFEVTGALAETWSWPAVVGRVVFVLLAAGLGVAAILAWFHGERGHQRVSGLEGGLLLVVAVAGAAGVGTVLSRSSPEAMGSASAGAAVGVGDVSDDLRRSVLVLPFSDLSPEGGRAYLGDGIAETLINGLGRIEELRVVARTSAFAFREAGLDVREIADRLEAGTVVEGTVTQIGDQVRITANLSDAGTGLALWSDRFDRQTSTAALFDLQDEIAHAILEALAVELGTPSVAPSGRVVRGGTRSKEAQDAYYAGLEHWTARTTEDMVLAARYFNEAVAADSGFADAWAGLALAYALHTPSEYGVPGFSMQRGTQLSIEAANRALELDPDNEAAFTALGDALVQRGQWEEAEAHFRRAIDLNPGYAGAHHWLGDLLMIQLRGEEALEELEIAESLSPVAPAIVVEKASALLTLGRTDEALAQMDRAVGLLPDARLVRGFSIMFSLVGRDWDRLARDVGWAWRNAGAAEDAAEAAAAQILDPEARVRTLRRWQEGRMEGAGEADLTVAFGRLELRMAAARLLEGDDAALDILEEGANGPERYAIYGPVLPAIMGPELSSTERARSLIRLAYTNRQ